MGVISTPPRPALWYSSSSRVMSASSTALPSHHQRVHGRIVRVTMGQAVSGRRVSAPVLSSGCVMG